MESSLTVSGPKALLILTWGYSMGSFCHSENSPSLQSVLLVLCPLCTRPCSPVFVVESLTSFMSLGRSGGLFQSPCPLPENLCHRPPTNVPSPTSSGVHVCTIRK